MLKVFASVTRCIDPKSVSILDETCYCPPGTIGHSPVLFCVNSMFSFHILGIYLGVEYHGHHNFND